MGTKLQWLLVSTEFCLKKTFYSKVRRVRKGGAPFKVKTNFITRGIFPELDMFNKCETNISLTV